MRRATTPTHIFTFPEAVKVDEVGRILISYTQNGQQVLEKTLGDLNMDAETNSFSLKLTQKETDLFAPGKALIQLRIQVNETTLASQMIWLTVKPVLNSKEM